MQSFEALLQAIDETRKDVEKADRGNSAAGTRVRKAMQRIKQLAQEVRSEVLAMRAKPEQATTAPANPAPCCSGPKPAPDLN